MFGAKSIGCVVVVSFVAATSAAADVSISDKPTQNMSCDAGVCTPAANKAVLNVTDLANLLASGDVTVNTAGSLAKDIDISAALSWASTSRLTLDAFQSITVKKTVSVTGTGALTITTNDGGTDGDLYFFNKGNVAFWDLNSSLLLNGRIYTLVGDVQTLAADINQNPSGFYALAKSSDAAGIEIRSIPYFAGILDGLGNSIANLRVRKGGYNECYGLIAVTAGSVIRDFALRQADIRSRRAAIGGLVGCNEGVIANASVGGKVRGGEYVGGLVGYNVSDGVIERSRSEAAVSGTMAAGGLVARNDGVVDQSYETGAITGDDVVGGLIALNDNTFGEASVTNSYATGPVNANTAGGFIGSAAGTVGLSYSTGSVKAALAGGFAGQDDDLAVSTSYWDLDTSGIGDPGEGAGEPPGDPGIAGLTDDELKAKLPEGFDPKIWAIDPKINGGYPYLISNPPP